MGTTLANFQLEGNFPVTKDLLNRLEIHFDMLRAVALSILAEIPSAPVALVKSSERMRSRTCSLVHRNSPGKLGESSVSRLQISLTSQKVKLGTEWLKLLKNWLLRMSAFCTSSVTVPMLGASRTGMEDSFLVSNLNSFQNIYFKKYFSGVALASFPVYCKQHKVRLKVWNLIGYTDKLYALTKPRSN